MDNWIDITNFGFAIGGLVIAFIGLFINYSAYYLDNNSKIFFRLFFLFLVLYVSSNLLSQISLFYHYHSLVSLSRFAIFIESLSSSVLLLFFSMYLMKHLKNKKKKTMIFYIAFGLWVIYFAILVITQFTQNIYYFTDDNVYHRGRYYSLLLIPPILAIALNLLVIIKNKKALAPKIRKAFCFYLIIPLICSIVQMFTYGLFLIVIGTSISALLMMFYIVNEQVNMYILQKEETIKARTNTMLLQMRPHFIYNTMTSIYYLCEQNPDKAMETINNFTNYLRRNYSAISSSSTIPFKDELEHVQAYLAIEQTRFEDNLTVEFDTPNTNFRLPPLTLQPIVENSVKYGVDPELNPLHIKITSKETEKDNVITVTDTGPGFDENDPMPDDNKEPHVALKNIRERLDIMSNGSISIEKKAEGGTEVTIIIPKNYEI